MPNNAQTSLFLLALLVTVGGMVAGALSIPLVHAADVALDAAVDEHEGMREVLRGVGFVKCWTKSLSAFPEPGWRVVEVCEDGGERIVKPSAPCEKMPGGTPLCA